MKTIYFLLFTMMYMSIECHAQEFGYHFKMKNKYKWSTAPLIKYHSNDTTIDKKIHGGKIKANLLPDSNGRVKIDFWAFKCQPDSVIGNDLYVNKKDSTSNFYFEINDNPTLANPVNYISIPYALWQIGAITIPFKYRFANSNNNIPADASADFNAGIYIGRKWGRKRFYRDKERNHNSASFTAAFFTGPTVIPIKKENVRDTLKYTQETNELGWSVGVGSLYAYKEFSMGIFGGIDIPLSKYAQNWNHAYRPWVGLALGYKLAVFGEK